MTQDSADISALIDRISEATQSAENVRRLRLARPTAIFGTERPIAEAKLFGYDVNRYLSDPVFYVTQTLREKLWRWESFPTDDLPIACEVPAWLGHYPEYTFVGLDVAFNAEGVPIIAEDHPLRRTPDVRLLTPVDFKTTGWMPRILRWYDDLVRIAAGHIKVTFNMVWWRGCLDLAIALRGYEQFSADVVERPQFVHDLLAFLVKQRCRWWEAFVMHFGSALQPADLGDDWLNVPFISPRFFAAFVLPRYLEIEAFHGGIRHIHSCGNQAPLQRDLLQIKSLDEFEVSPWTDLERTLLNIPADKKLIISLHPNDVLLASPADMRMKLERIALLCRARRYEVVTSGLTPITPDPQEYIDRIRLWTSTAVDVLRPMSTDHHRS
jgi:hypothetical protein